MPKAVPFGNLLCYFDVNKDSKPCCISNCNNPCKPNTIFCWFCMHQCQTEHCQNEAMIGSFQCTQCIVKN